MPPPLGISRHSWKFLRNTVWRRNFINAFNVVQKGTGRKLDPSATTRQMRTATAILDRLRYQKGILLADDVGTGKTTVAAWVVLVFAKNDRDVRILAPNRSMRRRWEEEMQWQFKAFAELQSPGEADKQEAILRSLRKRVRVTTHYRATKTDLQKDLVVIDEVHRAKNEKTDFAKTIKKASEGTRLLVLTATPFSLSIAELGSLLKRIGAPQESLKACKLLAQKLERLWSGLGIGQPDEFAKDLVGRLKEAHREIRGLVFRTSVDELCGRERRLYGHKHEWNIPVAPAAPKHLQLLAEMDRLGQVGGFQHHNDPCYHQGWRQIDKTLRSKSSAVGRDAGVLGLHRATATRLRRQTGNHPKLEAVSRAIKCLLDQGEKVVVFCDYHVTATEVVMELDKHIGARQGHCGRRDEHTLIEALRIAMREDVAIKEVLKKDTRAHDALVNFRKWLTSPGLAVQFRGWFSRHVWQRDRLVRQLVQTPIRIAHHEIENVITEATHLFLRLVDRQSSSTRSLLLKTPERLPGWHPRRVVGLCDPVGIDLNSMGANLFVTGEPDAIMAIFNSPFGPEVLVTTDRLSEGIDLHRFCRHLVHYELDPSPLRIIQREGRIRRIGSWASRTHQPVEIATPSLRGTRDARLVTVVRNRLQQFNLLLGGVNREVTGNLLEETVVDQEHIVDLVKRALPRQLSLRPR